MEGADETRRIPNFPASNSFLHGESFHDDLTPSSINASLIVLLSPPVLVCLDSIPSENLSKIDASPRAITDLLVWIIL